MTAQSPSLAALARVIMMSLAQWNRAERYFGAMPRVSSVMQPRNRETPLFSPVYVGSWESDFIPKGINLN